MTSLKLSFNANRIEGPYGGGNQALAALEKHLVSRGHRVYRGLVPDLDLILIASAQWNRVTTAYSVREAARYAAAYPQVCLVQRLNTADEPRGADLGINRALLEASTVCDHLVFVSQYMRELFLAAGLDPTKPGEVILNGSDEAVFHPAGLPEWRGDEPLRLVTHHWSSNFMKGFDVYERLDQLFDAEPWRGRFSLTCIGHVPLGIKFRNVRLEAPLAGAELATRLRAHHAYLTAARNEPAGNHYIEAVNCGLPVLYLQSGSLPEYCAPYGLEFTLANFESKLEELRARYAELKPKLSAPPYPAARMAEGYERLFLRLVAERRAAPRPEAPWTRRLAWGWRQQWHRFCRWWSDR